MEKSFSKRTLKGLDMRPFVFLLLCMAAIVAVPTTMAILSFSNQEEAQTIENASEESWTLARGLSANIEPPAEQVLQTARELDQSLADFYQQEVDQTVFTMRSANSLFFCIGGLREGGALVLSLSLAPSYGGPRADMHTAPVPPSAADDRRWWQEACSSVRS